MGSGTTVLVAERLNRIGWDIEDCKPIDVNCSCQNCMMWRIIDNYQGYCGLAGKEGLEAK